MRGYLRERKDRAPGYWELVVENGRDPVTSKRRQIRRGFRGGRRAAETALAKLVTEVERGQHRATQGSFAHLLDRWLEVAAQDLQATTLEEYRGLVRRHLSPALGDASLAKLTAADLDAFYRALSRRGLSPSTVRQVHAVARRALTQAVRWGWIASNPATSASPPRQRRIEINPPAPAIALRLVEVADEVNPELGVFIRLAAATGARRGELCALRWSNIDLESGMLTIRRSIADLPGGPVEKSTKTNASRRLALDADTVAALRAHSGRMASRAAAAGTTLQSDGFVFSALPNASSPWNPNHATKAFGRLRAAAGADGVRLHDLRHMHVTQLLAAGVPVRTVSGRVGHSRGSTTTDIYAHWLPESDRAAADITGEILRRQPAGSCDAQPRD